MESEFSLWLSTLKAEPLYVMGLFSLAITGLYLGITAFFRSFKKRSARWFGLLAIGLGLSCLVGGFAAYLAHQSYVEGATANLSQNERGPSLLRGEQISSHLFSMGAWGSVGPLGLGALGYLMGKRKSLQAAAVTKSVPGGTPGTRGSLRE